MNCYRNALTLADDDGLESIAFPAISTGVFGYPVDEAAGVAIQTVIEASEILQNVRLVRFVLFGERDLEAHERILQVSA